MVDLHRRWLYAVLLAVKDIMTTQIHIEYPTLPGDHWQSSFGPFYFAFIVSTRACGLQSWLVCSRADGLRFYVYQTESTK